MSKTLMMTTIAIALAGIAATPSASALSYPPDQFKCATTDPDLAWVVRTCNWIGRGGAANDLDATVDFVAAEAGELVGHEYVTFPSGQHRCASPDPELLLVVQVCNYVLGGGARTDAGEAVVYGGQEAGQIVAFIGATYGDQLP